MKKTLALVLTMVLCISFTGCGGSQAAAAAQESPTRQETTDQPETEESQETAGQQDTEQPREAPASQETAGQQEAAQPQRTEESQETAGQQEAAQPQRTEESQETADQQDTKQPREAPASQETAGQQETTQPQEAPASQAPPASQETVEPRTPSVQKSYETATVSYLGPEGTYTQEACEKFFDEQGTYLPYVTVNDAVEAVVAGETDYAVIPQENTIGGAVIDYVDTLIAQTEVSVAGEVELPITQNLLVLPGTTMSDIRTVYSHKQGIAQGKEWLETNLPGAEVVEVSSTAEGARMVSEGGDKSCAAIASAGCADVYGLEIMAAGIQNNENNKTRFYVLTMEEPSTESAERLAFIAAGSAEDIPALMAVINDQKMTLITIHDRPQKTELGSYYYLIECSDSSYESYEKLTEDSDFVFRFLGCFDAE